jgi:hypothetical protein
MDPARTFKESLTSRPELEKSQGQLPRLRHCNMARRSLLYQQTLGRLNLLASHRYWIAC